jgi:chromosome condensin MukBEF complex kleisin-like MukF subunit
MQPHVTTDVDFVSTNCQVINKLFHKVLLICDQSGLIGKEHFAIDGCKLPTDASKHWRETYAELRKKSDKMKQAVEIIVSKHISNDTTKSIKKILEEIKATSKRNLTSENQKIDLFIATNRPRMGKGKRTQEVRK